MGLVDIHETLSSYDAELEKEAAVEYEKLAEEDAAGRIMARGFMDELQKIAGGDAPGMAGGLGRAPMGGPAQTIKSKPYATSGGATGPKRVSTRATQAPGTPTPTMSPAVMGQRKKPLRGTPQYGGLPRPKQ
jgi:hypothetical protein